ncbi:type IV pilus modification PilV family protein [Teredinibacter waterburyi]|jgi:hypothetical protein|uniref:type IV pilus modification PilV family protein n=1 Tax=Teredinibacter waterburyi TaxID=1500538 RepID=UPI00165FDE89|nr:prepilin-type N-terminal cleavage/methylation domain-containing protein [Teredinibacter waterburyi]
MPSALQPNKPDSGVTLIETIVFLVVIAIALTGLMMVFNESVTKSVDPVVRIRALELGQGQLDEVMSRKFDENTPTGGIPHCGAVSGVACLGITADSGFDDVGDYDGFSRTVDGYSLTVSVSEAGDDLGLSAAEARLVQVVVTMPGGDSLQLAAYRANF